MGMKVGSQLRTEVIPASGLIVLGPANFLFITSVSVGSMNVSLQQGGASYGAAGVVGGYLKANRERWDRATIAGTVGATVTYFYGDEDVLADVTDFRTQIAVLSGVSQIAEAPSSTVASPASLSVLTVTAQTIAANLARKRITLGANSANTGSVFVQAVGAGAGRGVELQPGAFAEFRTTAALDVRNDTAGTQVVTIFEES